MCARRGSSIGIRAWSVLPLSWAIAGSVSHSTANPDNRRAKISITEATRRCDHDSITAYPPFDGPLIIACGLVPRWTSFRIRNLQFLSRSGGLVTVLGKLIDQPLSQSPGTVGNAASSAWTTSAGLRGTGSLISGKCDKIRVRPPKPDDSAVLVVK